MAGGFQTQVTNQPAPAVEGDFASQNPRWSVDFGPGGAVAGPSGLLVGRACWAVPPDDANGAPAVLNSFGTGAITGIVAREQQGLITTYLSDATLVIPTGFQATAYSNVDIWVRNFGAAQALVGQKAYATFANGRFTFGATGAPTGGGTSSASTIAATTFSATASITNNIMTASAVGSGTIYPGSSISGTNVTSGSMVQAQLVPLLAGEAYGGVGRYYVSIPEQTVVSTTISGTYGLLTIGGTVVSGFATNNILAATGSVVAGTTITAANNTVTPGLTGTGAAGTYVVNNNTAVSSQAINVSAINVETKWIAMSSALPNELVKISAQPLG